MSLRPRASCSAWPPAPSSAWSLAWIDPALAGRVADIVQPVGRLWLNALQMTVVPLVLALVIVGVTTASDAATSGRTARRAIVVFLVLLSAARHSPRWSRRWRCRWCRAIRR